MQPRLIEPCRIHISEELGRSIAVVSEDNTPPSPILAAGTRIFTVPEQPYASILHDEYLGTRCEECFRELGTLDNGGSATLACPGCSLARFCSSVCLQTAFQTWHGFECGKGLSTRLSNTEKSRQQHQQQQQQQQQQCPEEQECKFSLLARLALRVFWREYRHGRWTGDSSSAVAPIALSDTMEQQKHEQPLQQDGSGLRLDHLCTNQSKMEEAEAAQDRAEAEKLTRWLGLSATTTVFSSCLATIMAMLRSNAIGIRIQHEGSGRTVAVKDSTTVVTQESIMIGTGLYLLASMVNHSCAPNAMIVFGGNAKAVTKGGKEPLYNVDLRALNVVVTENMTDATSQDRGVTEPSMVTISYGPQKGRMLKAERKKLLRENEKDEVDQLTIRIRQLQMMADQKSQRDSQGYSPYQPLALLKLLEAAQALLYSTYSSQEYGATCDQIARVYAELGDFEESATWSKKSLSIVQYHYGDDSIETAQEIFKLAGLLFNSRRPKEALDLIEKAIPIYKKHYGAQSINEELLEMQEMELCLRQIVL
ncbi:SET and MYND domain-containing protein 4 [Actinomortierella ambigua]|uniref:SET and MYND domain-containing protein 4 n=1 Tax=Actinomortierella ambigua TaxID=1343610 RepID=A0A9P6QHN3_9FUNG|nr:SET and MYND domain-containing protein 4 [Actinomortierella ambigua]